MDELPTKQFWMVYGLGCGEPTKMHSHFDIAKGEASRLARNNPGTTFVVLEAVAACMKRDVDFVTLKNRREDDGIPF